MRLAGRQGGHGMRLGMLLESCAKQHMSIMGPWDDASWTMWMSTWVSRGPWDEAEHDNRGM